MSAPFSTPSTDSQGSNVGAIAGGTVGGVIGLASAGALFFFLMRRRRQSGSTSDPPKPTPPLPPPTSVSHEPQSSSSTIFNSNTPPPFMSVNPPTSRDPALFKDLNSPYSSSYLIAPPDTPVIVAVATTSQHPPPLPMLPPKHPSQFLSNEWSAPVPLPATPTFGAVNSTPVSSAKQASLAGTLPAPISVATTPSTDSTAANSAASAQPFAAAQTDSPHWAYVYLVGPVLAQSISTNFPPDVPVLTVEHPFVPSRPDEIVLRSGDHFKLRTLFRDGWVWGTNVDTDQSGLIPLYVARLLVYPHVSTPSLHKPHHTLQRLPPHRR
ncbi:hypothetical protein M427DRAFT_353099 [Gonapodya prolifera JEL478]|uniref:SH3 domain-containing protein n=1 Tax=Gonapodya prolifera (strain JEL478) TaxID=1344416 RepID=A0A139ACI9_GONPJ|nr:hypothetical protein M427DRAFT_353099 [Gonapodya prolifera JEL478]|eukprot:KXS14294.1 hypothetical protein M427DRAFT_353099 [Gonapodya prolifera JEL478]